MENTMIARRLLLTAFALGNMLAIAACAEKAPSAAPEVLATGKALYMEHCASCHRANLEGQPNWQVPNANGVFPAPPHTRDGHTWHHPDALLLRIIAEGGTTINSEMPAFGDRLTEEEMKAILAFIKSFW
jgi:mono/diheme cytochrome c family protein